MSAAAAIWFVLVALLLAAGVIAVLVAARRPEGGWSARLREVLTARGGGDQAGVVAEHRQAAEGETVGILELLEQGDERGGYLTVPQRYEDRFDEITEGLLVRQRAFAEKVRTEREERTRA